jgi:energy-coupling factor transporter transmembrane protein EcfT
LPDGGANECAAFPPALRGLSILIMVALWVGFAMSLPTLRTASWSTPSLLLFCAAGVFIVWMGYWLLHSRTRLDGDTLTQTWLWTKRVHASEVAQMKLVHWPMVEAVMVPRLLVRQRNGALVWFQASDAKVLEAFMARTIAARSA